MELNSPPRRAPAAGTASGPAADKAEATILTAGVLTAQLGGTDNLSTNVPAFSHTALDGVNSVPRPQCGTSPAPAHLWGARQVLMLASGRLEELAIRES